MNRNAGGAISGGSVSSGAIVHGTTTSVASGGGGTVITFNDVDFDNGSYHSGSSFSELTVPTTGIYQINGVISWPDATGSSVYSWQAYLNHNGSIDATSFPIGAGFTNQTTADITSSFSYMASLTAGDTIGLVGFQNSGSAVTPAAAYLSVFLIN